MCGIVAKLTREPEYLWSELVDILTKLDYRGYDAHGIVGIDENNEKWLYKNNGKILKDNEIIRNAELYSKYIKRFKVGLAHTRWASRGVNSLDNTHPIQVGKIFVVHNGIVTNADKIKEKHDLKWFLRGDTDTEVVAAYLHNYFASRKEWFTTTVMNCFHEVEGNNAFVILNTDLPQYLFAFVTGNGNLFASDKGHICSDINALSGYADKVKKLENNGIYCFDYNELTQENFSKKIFDYDVPPKEEIKEESSMLSEIKEQYNYYKTLYPPYLTINENTKNIIITGCGSSFYAGMFGQRCLEQITKIKTQCKYASEFMHCSPLYLENDNQFIAISQSGESKDVLDAIAPLPYNQTLIITNVKHSSINQYGQDKAYLNCGIESAVAATKTFFSTCHSLAQLSIMMHRFKHNINLSIFDLWNIEEDCFPSYIKDVIEQTEEPIKNMTTEFDKSPWFQKFNRYLFLGSNLTYPIALEAALKMKEVAYYSAEGMPSREMRHGPIALVDDETLSVFILSRNNISDMAQIQSNIDQIQARNGKILVVMDDFIKENYDIKTDYEVVLPKFKPKYKYDYIITSLALIIPLQYLAYYTAIRDGLDPNKPRNLCKTVTV